MRTPKEFYSYYVFQPDEHGVWIRRVTGHATGCRQFFRAVKKLFPDAFYKASYDPIFCKPISVSYMDGGEDLFQIENYYAEVL